MAKKRLNLKFAFDAPVTISFALFSIILFFIDGLILKGKLSAAILSSPTASTGSLPFVASSPASYARLLLYVFGAASWSALLANLLFILLLGPSMEERYGSVVIGIMMVVSALFTGVLNACFCSVSMNGCTSIVFMMIFLNSFMSFSKKKLPLSFFLIFVIYIAYGAFQNSGSEVTAQILGIVTCVAGGLCGSLFAFLTSPKAKAAKKAEGQNQKSDREAYLEELDSQSPRNKKNNRNSDDDDGTTVVGTLKF